MRNSLFTTDEDVRFPRGWGRRRRRSDGRFREAVVLLGRGGWPLHTGHCAASCPPGVLRSVKPEAAVLR